MGLKEDLIFLVDDLFSGQYKVTQGNVIPNTEEIELGKKGRELDLAMLFIDIRESTKIVDGFRRVTAAKMYKSFLRGVVKIIKANGGELCSFNGDGVLAAFIGSSKCTNAAKAALQLSWFCIYLLRPKLHEYFSNNNELEDMHFEFGIGVDTGKVLVVRGGIKGESNNDLVWAGNATNYAVKLSSIKEKGYNVYISKNVFTRLADASKYSQSNKHLMWEERYWEAKQMKIFRSNWTWAP